MLPYNHFNGAIPMVNPSHAKDGLVKHLVGTKKSEWFLSETISSEKLLVPAGTYMLIKKLSAKEEHRRVVSGFCSSCDSVAFDNKLSYLHQNRRSLEVEVDKE